MLNVYDYGVTFSELKDYINVTFFVSGCPYKCRNCSWASVPNKQARGISIDKFKQILKKYKGKCESIVFLGGEWYSDFVDYLKESKLQGFKTCLYTGVHSYDIFKNKYSAISNLLDYIKVGQYDETKGGLQSKTTNQKMFKLVNGIVQMEVKFYE